MGYLVVVNMKDRKAINNSKYCKMKKSILIGLLMVGSTLVFSTSCSNSSTDDTHHDDTKHMHSTEYVCPMKCEGEKTYEEPGSCPKCGMDLVVKK